MYKPFISFVHELLRERDMDIIFVDVGSRNGVIELKDIAEFVHAYGFEPNPEEYNKLITGKTDAAAYGIKSSSYRSLRYSSCALADTSGRRSFYVTKGPGAAGLLEPNMDRLNEIRWKGRPFKKSFAEDIFSLNEVIETPVKTLQEFVKEESIDAIDYLKIDVEGGEFEVLKGASDFLSHVGVIKVEVCFIPFRKEQKLFSDVDLLVRGYGFDLLRYEISNMQIGFKERKEPWSFGPSLGFPERYGQPLSCDAVYVNRSIRDPARALAQAVVLLEKKYLDEALFIFRKFTDVEAPEFFQLLETYRGQWRSRLLDFFVRIGRRFVRSPQLWK